MKNNIREVLQKILGEDEEVILADGLEEAFIGIARQFGKPFAVYSKAKTLEVMMSHDMTEEEALEFFTFNVEGAFVGDHTPAFMEDTYGKEVNENGYQETSKESCSEACKESSGETREEGCSEDRC